MTPREERAANGYLTAWSLVHVAGYAEDIAWATNLGAVKPDAQYILQEGAWVIVNSGFRYAVARKLWPGLQKAFHEFDPEKVVWSCIPDALLVLRHEKKMRAIVELANVLRIEGIDTILAQAKDPPQLTSLSYIGKVTCWHFAKVLGADVVKPDVHLERAAKAAGYERALALCEAIREKTGDRLTVIDSVLWRYGEQREKQKWATWAELFGGKA